MTAIHTYGQVKITMILNVGDFMLAKITIKCLELRFKFLILYQLRIVETMNHVEINKKSSQTESNGKIKDGHQWCMDKYFSTSIHQIMIFLWYEERDLVHRITNWHIFITKLNTYFK